MSVHGHVIIRIHSCTVTEKTRVMIDESRPCMVTSSYASTPAPWLKRQELWFFSDIASTGSINSWWLYFAMEDTVPKCSKKRRRRFFCQNFRFVYANHHSVERQSENESTETQEIKKTVRGERSQSTDRKTEPKRGLAPHIHGKVITQHKINGSEI